MREYNVTITMKLESDDSNYEDVEMFSQKIADSIMDKTNHSDIEVVEVEVDNIDDFNNYDIDMGDDFSDYDE